MMTLLIFEFIFACITTLEVPSKLILLSTTIIIHVGRLQHFYFVLVHLFIWDMTYCINLFIVKLILSYLLAPATITNVSSDERLLEGSDLQLFCIASGRPTPNITWVRIFPSGRESDVLHRETTWDLKNISRTENGTYRCTASNGGGSPVSRALRIIVECEFM